MSELKLKVWDKTNENFVKLHGITFDTKSFAPFAIKVSSQSWQPADKFQLLQWTGLYDDCKKEVYEGDVIDLCTSVYKVIWNDISAGFELIELEGSLKRNICDVSCGRLVGSIFENQTKSNS